MTRAGGRPIPGVDTDVAPRVAVRHPAATARVFRALPPHKQAQALRILVARLPDTVQRTAWRVTAATTRHLTGIRGPDQGHAAPAAVLAAWELGERAQAEARLEQAATNDRDRLSTRTAVRLAAVALAIGRPAEAERLLAGRTLHRGRDHALAAEVAFETGRFTDADAALDAAERAGYDHELLRRLRARIASERLVLEPSWRPALTQPRKPGRRPARARGRVLHLVTNSLPDTQAGYTLRTQQVARSQQAAGLEPHLATRLGYPGDVGRQAAPATEYVDGVPVHRLGPDETAGLLPDMALARGADLAAELVEKIRPAVLQPASRYRNAQVALALRDRYGTPVVYEVRGFLEETWLAGQSDEAMASDRFQATKAVETACMLAADAVVTLSETMRNDIIGRGVKPDRVIVVPNGVDPDAFEPRPRDAELAAALGIGPDEVVLGYITTLNVYEGVRYLLEAGATLRDRGHRVRILVVGDGPDRPALEEQAASLGLLGRDATAVFAGRVPHAEIARYHSLIDVFVVPRTADRVSQLVTPLKPYEAMAMARALVASDVAALREVVDDGQTGLLFRAGDSDHLADVVEPLLGDPTQRARLGDAARGWVLEHRTWRRHGERYRELFARLGAA